MYIENDDLIGVSKKANPFIRHLYGAVMHLSKQLYRVLQLFSVKLNLGIGHLDWRQFFCLTV
jgi:hypothetical protein